MNDTLRRSDLAEHPYDQFQKWWQEHQDHFSAPGEVNAWILATASPQGIPSIRTVLVKEWSAAGFHVYTNFLSRKGRELEGNPRASLLLYDRDLARQIILEGRMEKIEESDAEAYFRQRPRGSQIGAWASRQSEVLKNRELLDERVAEEEKRFAGRDVDRPPHWGGFRLVPWRYEFWQGRADRLHDRFEYIQQESGAWTLRRLNP